MAKYASQRRKSLGKRPVYPLSSAPNWCVFIFGTIQFARCRLYTANGSLKAFKRWTRELEATTCELRERETPKRWRCYERRRKRSEKEGNKNEYARRRWIRRTAFSWEQLARLENENYAIRTHTHTDTCTTMTTTTSKQFGETCAVYGHSTEANGRNENEK